MRTSNTIWYNIAFRVATWASVLVALFFTLMYGTLLSWGEAYLFGVLILLLVFFTVYTVITIITKHRLERLSNNIKAIHERTFIQQQFDAIEINDEIDELLSDTIKTSAKIEKEFERLFKLENYRKDFIGDISHELKTPIFAIQGFIEALIEGALADPNVNRKFLNKALKNVNRLTLLTSDLMEIAKLETGELKPLIRPFRLSEIIAEVYELLAYKAEEEAVVLKINDIDTNLKVLADRNQLRQVMVNLIENGIKYNKSGGSVTIGVFPYEMKDLNIWVYVKDTGIGMDQKDIPRVTERFFRIDKSRSREKGGTGLGLAIVKHILESHGNQLRVTSEAGKGSVFSFSLKKAE